MWLVTAKQMQEMDGETISDFGIPGRVLMENAGKGAAEWLVSLIDKKSVRKIGIFAGRGNNGGDGLVMARYLTEKGFQCTVFLFGARDDVKGDAGANLDLFETLCAKSDPFPRLFEIRDAAGMKQRRAAMVHQDLYIDALLGTGLNSEVKGLMKAAIEQMNHSRKPVFSVDIPSGLDADTGKPLGTAVKAFATATFAFAKAGHILYPGNIHTGTLRVIDIGIPAFIAQNKRLTLSLIEKQEIAALFPPRALDSHKGRFGHLFVVAGSVGKTGAAALCADAAMRCGTGLVTLGVPESLNPVLEGLVLEAMTQPLTETKKGILTESALPDIEALTAGKQALAIGPGLGTHEGTRKLIRALVEKSPVPLVLDADAVNCLSDDPNILKKKASPAVLTPHPGEMARISGCSTREIQADRVGSAKKLAAELSVILVLKGAGTVIALPDGRAFISSTGNPGMASGGMGDVLTGMIAGFVAQGLPPESAALAGVYIHGLCADLLSESMGPFGYLASDVIRALPETLGRHIR